MEQVEEDLIKIKQHLVELLGPASGFFGRINTWGQRPTKYEYIGYELSEDLMPTLRSLSQEKKKLLVMLMTYFEMHMRPLKKLISYEEEAHLYQLYSDIAWSHFSTLVMFGMLEIAIKGQRGIWLRSKGARIKDFLDENLSPEVKLDIAKRYKADKDFGSRVITDFGSVVDHMWEDIRGGFVHDAGIQYRSMEWHSMSGMGSKENPIRITSDVPMQEWLQITWQSILHSLGYKGTLELPPISQEMSR